MEREKATSLRRAIELLLTLAGDDAPAGEGLGVNRLAELLGDDKSRVSRTLRTLEEYSFVQRDSRTLSYHLGWRLYALASRAGDARLREAAPAVLRELVDEFGESAHLSVLAGARVLTVISRASAQAVTAAIGVGGETPAHCTSSGRALLLDYDLPALERLLGEAPLAAPGPRAPTHVAEVHARIVAARAVGYVIAIDESEPGLVAVGAPIRDHRGVIAAALNLSAPGFRFADRLPDAGRRLTEASRELAAAVGWQPAVSPSAQANGTDAVIGGEA